MFRSLIAVVLVCAVIWCPLGRARGEVLDEETGRAVAVLHPFGVRGLPTAYAGAARSQERQEALRLGLEWLAAHQAADGSWPAHELAWCNGTLRTDGAPEGKGKALYVPGVTGLATLAFLGAGYTHRGKHAYAEVVGRALTWLVKLQDAGGCVSSRQTQQYIYNHAFGAQALVEAYALTGDPKLQGPAQRALDFSALARNPGWAWRYGVKPGDSDTSVTGCVALPFYAALRLNHAGVRAGLIDPLSLDESDFVGVHLWLDKMTDPDYGRVGYVARGTGPARPMELVDKFPGEKSESCTAIAVLLRKVLPQGDVSAALAKQRQLSLERGVALMLQLKPNWAPGEGTIDLYYWYYATMALRHVGGRAWEAWDDVLASALLGHQEREGEACGVLGSWPPQGVWARSDGGRIYATAMALLMLETPDRVRHLPETRTDLLEALQAQGLSAERRAHLLRGIGVLRVPGGGEVVARHVGDESAQVCAAAATALGRLDAGSSGVRTLAGLLDDRRVEVRRAAVRALSEQGTHLKPHVAALAARLADPDAEVAAGAARALGSSGAVEAASALRPLLAKDKPVGLRVAVAAALFRLRQVRDTTLPVLATGLAAEQEATRIEAAATLEAMAPAIQPAAAALQAALIDPVPRVRVHAAGALQQAGVASGASVEALVAALDAVRGQDRLAAMERLARVASPRATPKLAAQVLTGGFALRIAAAGTLMRIGLGARPAAPALSYCCENGPAALRAAALEAYAALQMDVQAGCDHLLPVFDEEASDRRLRVGAVRGLVLLGADVVPHVEKVLTHGPPATAVWMLDVLARLGPKARTSASLVARVLDASEDAGVKRWAAWTLGELGPTAGTAMPQLEAALAHKEAGVRWAALQAVGKLAVASDEALNVLVEVGRDAQDERRALRLEALRTIGGLAERGLAGAPVLLAALQSEDEGVRQVGIDALHGLWPHSEPFVEQGLTEAGTRIRNGVAQVLVKVGPDAKRHVKSLVGILEAGAYRGRTPYGDALAAIGKPAVRKVSKLLRNPQPHVRAEAARVLGEIGPDAKSALGSLRRLLADPDWAVQRQAREAMEKIKPPRR